LKTYSKIDGRMIYNETIPQSNSLFIPNQLADQNTSICNNNISFSGLYILYHSKLTRFAKEYVIVGEDAENIVQDVFVILWERRDSLHLVENMNAYLFRLVRNKCLDHLRYKITSEKYNKTVQNAFEIELTLKLQSLDRLDGNFISEKSMESIISEAINSLPEKCREIFLSSRIEGLKYKEISERFGISINTVENQISIALRKLRIKLKNYLST